MSTDDTDDEESVEEPEAPAEKGRLGKPRNKAGRVASGGPRFDRTGNEADLIWNQMCEWLPSSSDPALPNRSPHDISMVVRRSWPPHPSGETQPVGRGFSGGSVAGGGDELPGSALINFVMRYYHLATTDQPASYDIHFFRKSNGSQITIGRLPMPSGAECRAAITASEQGRQAATGGPGLGYPNIPPPAQQPWPPQAYGAYAYPAPPASPGVDAATMNELSYLRGALGEALSAAREGRQPVIPPAPMDSSVGLEDRIVAKVLMAIRGAGGNGANGAPAPAVAVTAPVAAAKAQATETVGGLAGMVERMVGGILESTVKMAMTGVEKNIKTAMGMGSPYADHAPEAPEPVEVVAPPNPADAVPWTVAPVGSSWGNGSPVQVAIDKETGRIDPMGLAFANPVVAERVMGIVEGLGGALQEAIKKFSTGPHPSAAHVVKQIPVGAVDATPVQPPPPPPKSPEGGWGAPAT